MKALLVVTAALEFGGGIVLLIAPSLMATLLLGAGLTSPESIVVARIGGAALIAIGVSCWLERDPNRGAPAVGLVAGVLLYHALVVALLLYTASVGNTIRVGMWPAIAVHGALLVWCAACLRTYRRGNASGRAGAQR